MGAYEDSDQATKDKVDYQLSAGKAIDNAAATPYGATTPNFLLPDYISRTVDRVFGPPVPSALPASGPPVSAPAGEPRDMLTPIGSALPDPVALDASAKKWHSRHERTIQGPIETANPAALVESPILSLYHALVPKQPAPKTPEDVNPLKERP